MYNYARYPKTIYHRIDRFPNCDGADYLRFIHLNYYTGSIVEGVVSPISTTSFIFLSDEELDGGTISNLYLSFESVLESVDDALTGGLELAIETESFIGLDHTFISDVSLYPLTILHLDETSSTDNLISDISEIQLTLNIGLSSLEDDDFLLNDGLDGVYSFIETYSIDLSDSMFDTEPLAFRKLEHIFLDSCFSFDEENIAVSDLWLSPENIILESIDESAMGNQAVGLQRAYSFIVWFWDSY